MGDKVDDEIKTNIESAIEPLKKAVEGEDTEELKRLSEALTQASHKLAEAMYQQASQEGQPEGGSAGADDGSAAGAGTPEEDVVDADFEEVKEEDKK